MSNSEQTHDVVVIGSGFGGSMTALSVARAFRCRGQGETVLVLERGTWWTTPVGTVQDKEVKTYDFLRDRGQPVQFWSSIDHFRGLVDIFLRCVRRKGNEDGLFEFTSFGRKGFLGIGAKNDGVTVVRACGVGGGSLVYSNVTIRPPELIFDDPRWPAWTKDERDWYYGLARDAIGYGVIWARDTRADAATADKGLQVNKGLSNLAARTAHLDPVWEVQPDENGHPVRRLYRDPARPQIPAGDPRKKADPNHALWMDRARVFQAGIAELTDEFGTVDSSINDVDPEQKPFQPEKPFNYCERQGRCNIGCLPGARHTLNKQLMATAYGTPAKPQPVYDKLQIQALAEVDVIEELAGGGYRVHYVVRDAEHPSRVERRTVVARRLVLAAGCIGTNAILLRSRERGTLKELSPRLGHGFSTNGDYLAFLEGTKERVNLTRGPVTTSFGHFNTPRAGANAGQPVDPLRFHTVEDNGIARSFARLAGAGVPMLRAVAAGHGPWYLTLLALANQLGKYVRRMVKGIFTDHRKRSEFFVSEDEQVARMMCIAANGRDEARGVFRLGGRGETPLRVARDDGQPFWKDPIFKAINATLTRFAQVLTGKADATFLSPFFNRTAEQLNAQAVTLSHPLGGCRMADTAEEGVVDRFGRVWNTAGGVHPGLYVADASIIPTALGVNPSLTISALALRCADRIIEELPPVQAQQASGVCQNVVYVPKLVGDPEPAHT